MSNKTFDELMDRLKKVGELGEVEEVFISIEELILIFDRKSGLDNYTFFHPCGDRELIELGYTATLMNTPEGIHSIPVMISVEELQKYKKDLAEREAKLKD